MKPAFLLALTLAGLVALLGASSAVHAVGAAPDDPSAVTPVLGVNVDLVGAPAHVIDQTVERLASAGIGAVRVPIRWADVEPTRGSQVWGNVDELLAAFDAAGISVVASVQSSPDWARRDPAPEPHLYVCTDAGAVDAAVADAAPPTDPADLATFASALVRRYEGRLWAVEVWSEPNVLPHWRRTGPDPEDYAELLVETATAVREVDPDVLVVSAALAPTTDIGVCYLSDIVFLDRLARTGALDSVDGVGIAPYGLRDGPEDGDADSLGFGRAQALHDVLRAHDVDLPVWSMAWGWSGLPDDWSGDPSPWGDHGPETSARWLEHGYARARSEWPWMGPMFVWHDRPNAAKDDPVWGFGLVGPDGVVTERWASVASIADVDAGGLDGGAWAGVLARARQDMADEDVDIGDVAQTDAGNGARLVIALGLALAVVVAFAVRRFVAPLLVGLFTKLRGVGAIPLTASLAVAVLVSAFLPGSATWVALPALVVLAAARPTIAIAAVAVMAPLNHAVHMHVGATPVWPVELLVAAAVAGRLVGWYAQPLSLRVAAHRSWETARTRTTALDVLVVALVVWAGLSPLWAEHAGPALREWRTVIVEPAVLYALIRAAPDRRRAAFHAVDGLMLGAVLASGWALMGVALHITGDVGTAVAAQGVVRAIGPYASPNNLALYLGRILPVIGAFVVWGDRPRRVIYALAAVPIGLALLLTFSRGALVFGAPATMLYLIVVGLALARGANWRRVSLAAASVAAATVVLLVPFARTERIRSTFSLEPGSTAFIRVRLWQSAVDMIGDHPWLGVGLDNFLYLFRDRYVARDAAQERFLSHPHNALLDWWTRLGLPGLLLFAGLVWGNLRAGIRAVSGDPAYRALAVAALGMQVYAVAHGLVDNVFFLVDLAIVWWIAQAALLALVEDTSDPSRAGEPG